MTSNIQPATSHAQHPPVLGSDANYAPPGSPTPGANCAPPTTLMLGDGGVLPVSRAPRVSISPPAPFVSRASVAQTSETRAEVWSVPQSVPREAYAFAEETKAALLGYAIRHGFSLVVPRSSIDAMTLACAQGGTKRSHRQGGWEPSESLRLKKTKKSGCTYKVILKKSRDPFSQWHVVESTIHHSGHSELGDGEISALPSARHHLFQKHGVEAVIEERRSFGMSGSSIWSSLRAKFPWLIYEDIENTMAKLKTRDLDGLSEVEALHVMIKREHVHSTSLSDEENRLVRLFFAPKASAHLTHRYPDVLLMDATYKTNKYEMPLLHVVDVTGTNNHFTVACCFMDAETTDSYLWTIRELERYLYHAPRVVVVDDEAALIKALASVWPSCRVHLCRWHISKNIKSECLKPGMQRSAFDELLRGWNTTCGFAVSDDDFAMHWARTKRDLVESHEHPRNYPQRDEHTNRCLLEAFAYIDKNKVPQRHRFASYAINDSRHFANTSTSVAEGAHWTNIKSRLKSRSSLLDVFDRVKQSTEQRHNTISDRISRERVETLALPQSLFSPVLRQSTHHALRLVHKEYEKALHPTEISPCSGYCRQALGLPCAHDLLDFLRIGKPLSVELFDRHWHKDALTTDTDVIGVLAPSKVERIRGRTPKIVAIRYRSDTHRRSRLQKRSSDPKLAGAASAERQGTTRGHASLERSRLQ